MLHLFWATRNSWSSFLTFWALYTSVHGVIDSRWERDTACFPVLWLSSSKPSFTSWMPSTLMQVLSWLFYRLCQLRSLAMILVSTRPFIVMLLLMSSQVREPFVTSSSPSWGISVSCNSVIRVDLLTELPIIIDRTICWILCGRTAD